MEAGTSNGRVLIVDNAPLSLMVLEAVLKSNGFEVLMAERGLEAIELSLLRQPDLIILDVGMPGIDGFETCRRLKSHPATREIPIIFMTAHTDTVDKIKGFDVGAVDYITKPFEHREVLIRVSTHMSIASLQRELQFSNDRLEARVAELDRRNAALMQLFENVADGPKGAGPERMRELTQLLAIATGCSAAMICQREGEGSARTRALWHGGSYMEERVFPTADTPFAQLERGESVQIARGVCQQFPGLALLNELGGESFLGVPIRGPDGDVRGHLAVLGPADAGPPARYHRLLEISATLVASALG